MSEEIFGSDQNDKAKEGASEATSSYSDLLAGIRREDGTQKYKSVEDALQSLMQAQDHIKKIEDENRTFRSEIDKRLSIEQALQEFKAKDKPDGKPSQEFDPDAIKAYVDERLAVKETEQRAKSNVEKVRSALVEKYGEKANDFFTARTQELGLSKETLNKLATESPSAVLSMLGLNATMGNSVPQKSNSSVNTDSFSQGGGDKNYSYYQKLRKDNPAAYREQYQDMLREAEKQGEKFYR